MKEVTVYEVTPKTVLACSDYVEVFNFNMGDVVPFGSEDFLVNTVIEKVLLPIKMYNNVNWEEPRYIALSEDVKEILDIEIGHGEENRHLKNRVEYLLQANGSLRYSLEVWEALSWKEHVKIAWKKLTKRD